MTFETRPMLPTDIAPCVAIVNHIIALGGTTAYEQPFTEAGFDEHYRNDPAISYVVLLNGQIVGFQALFEVAPGVYSVGSFTDRKTPSKGAGRALFEATQKAAKQQGGTAILAKITADNAGGLAYYARMGFVDFEVHKADHIRSDGTAVDRIVKRFAL